MAADTISSKYFEALLEDSTCRKIRKLIGDRNYTGEEFKEKLTHLSEKDAQWLSSLYENCQAGVRRKTVWKFVSKIFSVLTAIWLITIFLLSLLIKDNLFRLMLLVTMIVFYLLYKRLNKYIQKQINLKISIS